ncbi:MAG TPA: hypothetical protein VG106_07455, partial [Vicinamibacterales bacterium]|nr:hypothetical protein [Vicinamibacterales bacterium]
MLLHHIAVIAAAVSIGLGPETRLTPPGPPAPAPSPQYTARVASNGSDFVAVWSDAREGDLLSLYASRLDAEGRPVEPFGTRVPGFAWAQIASNGDGYLIVDNRKAQRLDENGRPLGQPHAIPAETMPMALASNGSTYLSVGSSLGGIPLSAAMLFDRDGTPLRTIQLPPRMFVWLGAYGGRYVLITAAQSCNPIPCRASLHLHLIDDSGAVVERELGTVVGSRIAAAASRDRILMAGSNAPAVADVEFTIVDYDGNLVNKAKATTLVNREISDFDAAWDGQRFLL